MYPRANLHTLHTRDRWIREGRIVRDGEAPAKRLVLTAPSAVAGLPDSSVF